MSQPILTDDQLKVIRTLQADLDKELHLKNTLETAVILAEEATTNPEAAKVLFSHLHNSIQFNKLLVRT